MTSLASLTTITWIDSGGVGCNSDTDDDSHDVEDCSNEEVKDKEDFFFSIYMLKLLVLIMPMMMLTIVSMNEYETMIIELIKVHDDYYGDDKI